uniref:Putative N-carbamoylsarcosine amidase n=1 Tax=Rhodococcus sp. PY11 TaxID=551544 RepID=B5MAB4_9NOCA|nr:putative N-carbamoylsarcosine amidase [Rhodococcus sp. PY11]
MLKVGPPDQYSFTGTHAAETDKMYAEAGFGRGFDPGHRPAVIVVDFSVGFTDPTVPTGAELGGQIGATNRITRAVRALGLPVVHTTIAYDNDRQAATWLRKAPGLAALTTGSPLVALDPRLERDPGDTVLVKHHASAFFGTGLAPQLIASGVDTVIVCGATTSGCVRATAVDAVSYGFPVLVPRDCVGDRAAAPHHAALFDLQAKYADVTTAADILHYLDSLGSTNPIRPHNSRDH